VTLLRWDKMSKCLRSIGLFLACCLAADPVAAESPQVWELWVARPSRPGLLESCVPLKTMPWPLPAAVTAAYAPERIDQALTVTWQGGRFTQPGREGASATLAGRPWSPFDSCFVLTVRGEVVAAGAVIPHMSARLLRSDTLVLQGDMLGDVAARPLTFSLLPSFPAEIGQPVSAAWRHALTPISTSTQPRPQ
jgi:hypothetical protein